MTDKTVLNEVRGTIVDVYEYPDSNGKTKKGIVIETDEEPKKKISEAYEDRDYSQFSVGQRVVHVSYTWKRPANDDDRVKYSHYGKECPNEVDDFEYVTYDELSYDENRQSAKTR